MASPISILKSVLNLNKNLMHVEDFDETTVNVRRDGEIFKQKRIHVHARPYKRIQKICPVCRNKCPGYDKKRDVPSTWRAPNLNGVPVYICYCPSRIECPEHGILTEYIPWADGSSRFTEDFNNEVAWMVCQMSKTAIAQFMDINWRTVGNCIKAAQERIEPDVTVRMRGLRRICVDETSYRKGFAYITVVYDMDKNRVIWVHQGHGLEVFKLFCEALPQEERNNIRIVAGDGAKWIDTCVKTYFPNATRCIDFFHVAQWANEKLDDVRTTTARKARDEYEHRKKEFQKAEQKAAEAAYQAEEERKAAEEELASMPKRGRPSKRKLELLAFLNSLQDDPVPVTKPTNKRGRPRKEPLSPEHQELVDQLEKRAKDIKNSKHALGHKPENCTSSQNDKIKLIENSFPDLYRAYQLKEALRLILHMKDFDQASCELDQWIQEAAESGMDPMNELSEKISRHRDNILNSIKHQANSSKSEAVNTTIKVLIRMARGFKNMENLKALIYLKCSDLVVPLHNRYQRTPEKASAFRKTANELRKLRDTKPVPA